VKQIQNRIAELYRDMTSAVRETVKTRHYPFLLRHSRLGSHILQYITPS